MDKNDHIIRLARNSIALNGDIYSSEIARDVGVSASTVRKVLRHADRDGGLGRECTAWLSSGRRCGAPLPLEAWGKLGVTRCAAHTRLRVTSVPAVPAASIAEAGTGPVVERAKGVVIEGPLYPFAAAPDTPAKTYPLSVLDDIDTPIPFRPAAPAAPPMPEELSTALDGLTVEVVEGEPRASAFQLAELLGFKEPRAIKKLIDRNRGTLEKVGTIPCRDTVSRQATGFGEREYTVAIPWLNRTQCILVTGKANTANAEDAQIKIAKSFEREQDRAAAPPSVSPDVAALTQAVASLAATVATAVARLGVVEANAAPRRRPTAPPAPPVNQLLLSPAFNVSASAAAKGDYLSVSDIAERVGLPMDDRRDSSKRLVTTWLQEAGLWRMPSVARNIRLGMVAGGRASERDHWVYAPSILERAVATTLREAASEVTRAGHLNTRHAYELARAVIRVGLAKRAAS